MMATSDCGRRDDPTPAPAAAAPSPNATTGTPGDAPPAGDRSYFHDATATSGIDMLIEAGGRPEKPTVLDAIGGGVCLLDADGDGLLDVYLVNGSTAERYLAGRQGPGDRFYRNTGGGRFADASVAFGLNHKGWSQGCAVADWDNDGRPDLLVTTWGENVLYRNEGGSFRDVTASAGISGRHWSTSAAFADVDNDGLVDLYVANYLDLDLAHPPVDGEIMSDGTTRSCRRGVPVFCGPKLLVPQKHLFYHNEGDGRFREAGDEFGLDPEPLFGLGVVFTDFDRDGWIDLFVANDSVRNFLYRNHGGRLEELGGIAGVGYNSMGQAQSSMGADAADYDGDGLIDIVTTNFSEDYDTVYRNAGDWRFIDDSFVSGVAAASLPMLAWGVRFSDFNVDGREDLLIIDGHVYPQVDLERGAVTYRQRIRHYHNLGEGRFVEDGTAVGLSQPHAGRGLAVGDLDRDGDPDFVVTNLDEKVQIFRNDSPALHNALVVQLTGTVSNRDAIGVTVALESGGRKQLKVRGSGGSFLSQGSSDIHFGLGTATRVDRLEVEWPSGGRQTFVDLAVNQTLRIDEQRGLEVIAPLRRP